MWGIKTPTNEWFTGFHYKYNKDQDQTRREIKRLITLDTFTADTDYDDEGYLTIPTEVRYKVYEDKQERGGYATGVRQSKNSRMIETSDTRITFCENDKFKLMEQADDDNPFKITVVDYKRNSHKAHATLLLPGLYEEYNSTVVLVLE